MNGAHPDLASLAEKFAGQWVALDPDDYSVVASGDSAKGVLEDAETKGVAMPFVLEVVADYGQLAPWLA